MRRASDPASRPRCPLVYTPQEGLFRARAPPGPGINAQRAVLVLVCREEALWAYGVCFRNGLIRG